MTLAYKKYYTLFPLVILCFFYCYKSYYFEIHDFSNYYFGGYFYSQGLFNNNIYLPHVFNQNIANLGYLNIFSSYAPNTPFLAFVFAPLSFLNIETAKLCFNIFSTLLFIISIYKLGKFYKLTSFFYFILPILFFTLIKNNLLFGQVYFILFYLLTEFWIAYCNKKETKSALFLSIAILLKVSPLLFILIFLFKKQYKSLLICLTSCLILLGISTINIDFKIWCFWFTDVLPKALNGEISAEFVDNYQSIFMFLKRLFIFDDFHNNSAIIHSPILFKTIITTIKIFCLIISYYIINKKKNNLIGFSFLILASLLTSPYGSTYSLLILIFLMIYLTAISKPNSYYFFGLFLILLINNIPTSYFLQLHLPFSFLRLLLIITLIIVFFKIIGYSFINMRTLFLAPIIAFLISFTFHKKTVNTSLNVIVNSPILVYDYYLKNNLLVYSFWNKNGENQSSLFFPFKTKEKLKLKNNQIIVNTKQITFENDRKMKPLLINDSLILYLSDSKKGIGFYGLKSIHINSLEN